MLADPRRPFDGEADGRLLDRQFTARDLPQLRVLVEECAAWAGLSDARRGDFVLAVDEIATNAIEHAGGRGHLTLRRVGDELECKIADSGPGFSEDVIPDLLPGLDGAPSGRGLWLTRLVSDRLAISAGAIGAVVTLAMRLR
ncbi:ATP-binding protein [Streptomyces zagrosensis]|uniref:Anti-sigma regulatory factor (Ser/Thr protein kinase) n=1 Tax=Streptomyces zagrosensis TaxID=1042984 RepID=A0A7W9UY81_9ACTN|nr:ATP-binding protein [Streptomyces zagrosensis]MBB5935372.1 anti-sigma regulatory factor (Ser/Thr protein kinase) [Streptomyces zagrosensis]